MSRIYISDTNIWIDFQRASLLEALFELPYSFCSTDFVAAELTEFPIEALTVLGLQIEAFDGAAIGQLVELTQQHNNSSLADVSCYFLAQQTGNPLLTGDGKLRRQAKQDGIEVHGVLWLLDRLIEHLVIDTQTAARGLQAMLDQGARLPKAECEERLQAWMS